MWNKIYNIICIKTKSLPLLQSGAIELLCVAHSQIKEIGVMRISL